MKELFSRLGLIDVRHDVIRNIVSLRVSQDLFDDLSTDSEEWLLAQRVEAEVKPPPYRSNNPVIDRPFEDAEWFNAITWPFRHWQVSRFSDGSFGVWYGSHSEETTIYESAYHWYHGLISDAGFEQHSVVSERKLYTVTCKAALLDFRPIIPRRFPDLIHKTDYTFAQSVGQRMHREGHPGLLTFSARHPSGENYVIFNPAVLSDPRHHGYLTYRLEASRIAIEKVPGTTWMEISMDAI